MTNKEIYKRTLVFSVRAFILELIGVILLAGLPVAGFFLTKNTETQGGIGLLIGLVIGIIVLAVIARFTAYQYKAAQVAMMTRGITENYLPDDIVAAGRQEVKERFVTVALYFMLTAGIRALFNKLSAAISGVGRAVGGDKGGTVGSVIGAVIQTIVRYLCTCCLGWVFYRKGQNAFKATCEGAVIFFKHGKTFAKNMGRVFGIGALSFVPIVGGITAIFYFVFAPYSRFFAQLAESFRDSEQAYLSDPKVLMIVCAFVIGVIIWAIIHSTFIYPFVLVGVLRNYLDSGIRDIPAESSFDSIYGRSRKFDRLREKFE